MIRAALCAGALLLAPMAEAADPDRTRALLEGDGTRDWIVAYIEDMTIPDGMLPIDDPAALAEAAARHLNPDEVFEEILLRTAQTLNDDDLAAIEAWRTSAPGARILAAELAYEAPDCNAPDPECSETLARMEIEADPRLPRIRAVNRRGRFALLDLAIEVSIMREGWNAAMGAPGGAAEIDADLSRYALDRIGDMERWHDMVAAEIYAPFTPAEIAAYADFLGTEAEQAYLLVGADALKDALAARARRISREYFARPPTRSL